MLAPIGTTIFYCDKNKLFVLRPREVFEEIKEDAMLLTLGMAGLEAY